MVRKTKDVTAKAAAITDDNQRKDEDVAASEKMLLDVALEAEAQEGQLISVLKELLSSKANAGMMARAITEFQLQAHRAYKQKMRRRRLNEKETFICISLGAANFVNHLKEIKT